MDITKLILELLGNHVDADKKAFDSRGIEIINEIADHAEKTEIFKEEKERGEIFDGATAWNIWMYMLDRIVNAPTTIHRDMSVILIMPFIRNKLREEAQTA